MVKTIFEWSGKHELTQLITFGSTRSNSVFLNFDQDPFENFSFRGEGKTNKSVGGGGGEGDGKVGDGGSD